MSKVTVRRYLLFSGLDYGSSGGWDEYRGAYESLVDAKTDGAKQTKGRTSDTWYHVVDLKTLEVVDSRARI